MNITNKGSVILAGGLIGIGVLFLAINLLPGVQATWPILFFIIAAMFFLPPFIWTDARRGLSGLMIPGAIFTVLGLIFTYNTLTGDWVSWAYAWTLIPGGVGRGLALAAQYGGWGKGTTWVGVWLGLGSVAVFSIFAALVGGPVLRAVGPALLIVLGLVFLLRSRKS